MQGGQGMEEAGVRARPRPTRAKSHKEGSLLDPPPRPRPQASFTPARSALPGPRTAPGSLNPVVPPSASAPEASSFASNASASPHAPVNPPSHTPLLAAGRGPPTALPGGGCRSPSAIFSVRSRRGCSQFPLSVHPAPFPGSTKLPEGK